jgi:epoxyqueuosine reductase
MTSDFKPYQVDTATYRRFDQKNTCFARWRWDKEFIAYGKGIYDNASERIKQGIEGYSKEEFVAIEAAWHVHDTFARIKTLNLKELERDDFPNEVGNAYDSTPEQNSQMLKKFGNDVGAPLIGTTRVNMDWVYSQDTSGNPLDLENLPYAIVFTVPMDQEMLKKSPTYVASAAVGVAYSKCRVISESLADYIRQLGYEAMPAVNEIALSVPLAVDAGLGEFARNGLLIGERFGMGVRIGKVLTDMPLAQDSPVNLGVQRFCTKCKKCAENCPANAISFEDQPDGRTFSKSNNPGILKWFVNVGKCYNFWTFNSSDCSNCVTKCPFTKPDTWTHNLTRAVVKRTGVFDRLLARMDDWLYD